MEFFPKFEDWKKEYLTQGDTPFFHAKSEFLVYVEQESYKFEDEHEKEFLLNCEYIQNVSGVIIGYSENDLIEIYKDLQEDWATDKVIGVWEEGDDEQKNSFEYIKNVTYYVAFLAHPESNLTKKMPVRRRGEIQEILIKYINKIIYTRMFLKNINEAINSGYKMADVLESMREIEEDTAKIMGLTVPQLYKWIEKNTKEVK